MTDEEVGVETARRIAENESRFRDANEGIADQADTLRVDGQRPYLCECSDPRCVEIIVLDRGEYERVRSNPRWFAVARGHAINADGVGRAREDHEHYTLVEKIDVAGEVAAERDPRK